MVKFGQIIKQKLEGVDLEKGLHSHQIEHRVQSTLPVKPHPGRISPPLPLGLFDDHVCLVCTCVGLPVLTPHRSEPSPSSSS